MKLNILANALWLYYMPYRLLVVWFPLMVVVTVLGEAWILGRVVGSWKKCVGISIAANIASWLIGQLGVSALRGSVLPDEFPESFYTTKHLLAGFGVAFLMSVVIEAIVWKMAFKCLSWERAAKFLVLANLFSYASILIVNLGHLRMMNLK